MSRQNGECFIYQLELFLCFSCQDVSFNLVGWFSRTPPLAVVFGLTNQKREQTRFNGSQFIKKVGFVLQAILRGAF